MAGISVRSELTQLVAFSVGLRRSEIDGHLKLPSLSQRCSPTLCCPVLGMWIVTSVSPMVDISVRSESIRLDAFSVGLRRSEIDGHFGLAADPKLYPRKV